MLAGKLWLAAAMPACRPAATTKQAASHILVLPVRPCCTVASLVLLLRLCCPRDEWVQARAGLQSSAGTDMRIKRAGRLALSPTGVSSYPDQQSGTSELTVAFLTLYGKIIAG